MRLSLAAGAAYQCLDAIPLGQTRLVSEDTFGLLCSRRRPDAHAIRAMTRLPHGDCHRRCPTVCPLGFAQKTNLWGEERVQKKTNLGEKPARIATFAQILNLISRKRHGSRTIGPGLAQRSNVIPGLRNTSCPHEVQVAAPGRPKKIGPLPAEPRRKGTRDTI